MKVHCAQRFFYFILLVVCSEFDDISPLDLVEDAQLAGEMRLVVYRVGWHIPEDPHNKIVPKTLLVLFNPAEVSDPTTSRMYSKTQ